MGGAQAPGLRPEQEAALAYARTRGTEAPVSSITERLARTFGELDALLAHQHLGQIRRVLAEVGAGGGPIR